MVTAETIVPVGQMVSSGVAVARLNNAADEVELDWDISGPVESRLNLEG